MNASLRTAGHPDDEGGVDRNSDGDCSAKSGEFQVSSLTPIRARGLRSSKEEERRS